jgi:methylated-DNA-[protein]-cysteine S-methyltransferase
MTYARTSALLATPIGMVRIEGDDTAVHRIAIEIERQTPRRPDSPAVLAAAEQLEAWFEGALKDFDLALAPPTTSRGLALRGGLVAVEYGQTRSYGELARLLGSGPRAIGQLCARNPFPIVVPCHRILGSGGALGHYSAGDGVVTKRWLLDHEQRIAGQMP